MWRLLVPCIALNRCLLSPRTPIPASKLGFYGSKPSLIMHIIQCHQAVGLVRPNSNEVEA